MKKIEDIAFHAFHAFDDFEYEEMDYVFDEDDDLNDDDAFYDFDPDEYEESCW